MNINNGVKRWTNPCWTKTETMKRCDQIKENRSLSPWGWMVPILKMRRFSCLLRLSLPPEMGEMAQIFISEIEWLAALKCRATGLSNHCSLRNEGVQQICQIDVGLFHRCKVCNIYCCKIVHVKLCRMTKLDLGPEIDVAELRNEHV